MSKSNRDKNAWKARNPEKAWGENWYDTPESKKEYDSLFPTRDFPSIAWSIVGKRRRNNSRKSNQRTKPIVRQIDRAKRKVQTLKELDPNILFYFQ